jgi:hypothetical protein
LRLLARFGFLALIPLVPYSQALVERTLVKPAQQRQLLYLRTGAQVRRMFPGFEGLMASVYWLRVVQYYGHQRAFSEDKTFDLLQSLIEITNALDPRMELAYRYGAIFLSEAWPEGPGRPDEGISVLERGVENLPNSWRLRWDLGNICFFYQRDAKRASGFFLDASKLPGAPYWLESLAAAVLQTGGHREIARKLWLQQYENSGEGEIKDNALFHIRQIDSLDACARLSGLAARFAERAGRPPVSPQELVARGLLQRLPEDPSGVSFDYDASTGRFSIARRSKFWRARYD